MTPDPRIIEEDSKPERIHWLAWALVAAGAAALVAFAIVPGVRLKVRDAAFLKIRPNDPESRVVELMGPADAESEAACADLHRWWGDETQLSVEPQAVARVLTWRVWFPTGAVAWQVGLDNQHRAVARHRYD